MEHLSRKCCDLSEETHTLQQFAAAAATAQHPQHAALGLFLTSVTPDVLNDLRRLLTTDTNGVVSCESLGKIEHLLRQKAVTLDPKPPKVAKLCEEAKETLVKMKSYYNRMKLYLGSELEKLLRKYASEHPLVRGFAFIHPCIHIHYISLSAPSFDLVVACFRNQNMC